MTYNLEPLGDLFVAAGDKERAAKQKAYMRNKFEFIGLDAKGRREAQRNFFKEYGYPSREELLDVILALWENPYREFQHCALDLLQRFSKTLTESDIDYIEKLIISKSWWDTVDGLAGWICGAYFELFPEQVEKITGKWMRSGNFWLQRSCLLFQLKYKDRTDTELLKSLIQQLYKEKEFFIRKAIGWILREYSKTNPQWVSDYIKQQPLSALSYKEASKYI